MSFFNTEQATTGSDFEISNSSEPIPNNTRVNAMVDEVKWETWEGDKYISLRWTILAPEDYKNRKVFQKLYPLGDSKAKNSEGKADKAKRMLAAIDANCGGHLVKLGKEPSDTDLMVLLNKPMLIKLMVWEIDDKKGNWVAAVSASSAPPPPVDKADDDSIPF